MAIILKVNKVNLFVSSVLFVFWYQSPKLLDTPRVFKESCAHFYTLNRATVGLALLNLHALRSVRIIITLLQTKQTINPVTQTNIPLYMQTPF
jgi:hypothetical protein